MCICTSPFPVQCSAERREPPVKTGAALFGQRRRARGRCGRRFESGSCVHAQGSPRLFYVCPSALLSVPWRYMHPRCCRGGKTATSAVVVHCLPAATLSPLFRDPPELKSRFRISGPSWVAATVDVSSTTPTTTTLPKTRQHDRRLAPPRAFARLDLVPGPRPHSCARRRRRSCRCTPLALDCRCHASSCRRADRCPPPLGKLGCPGGRGRGRG